MGLNLGNTNIGEIYLGNTKIAEAYLGSSKIYSATPPGPTPETADIGGKLYKVAEMPDGKIWMCENLDYDSSGVYYNNDESTYGWNGLKYGKLYTWYEAAAAANEISGWHLPSTDEWDALATAVGGTSVAGTKFKSTTGWSSGNGTDDYGFTAFPAGWRTPSGSFGSLGNYTVFWTVNEYSSTQAWERYFRNSNTNMNSDKVRKTYAYSVRLVKDAT